MAAKAVQNNKQVRYRMNVHNCSDKIMYVVPDQAVSFDDQEIYAATFKKESSYSITSKYYPEDIVKSFHKYCPMCGTLLLQEYEVES